MEFFMSVISAIVLCRLYIIIWIIMYIGLYTYRYIIQLMCETIIKIRITYIKLLLLYYFQNNNLLLR